MADGSGLAVSLQASSSNDIQGHLTSDVAMQSPQPAAESGGSTDDPASSLRAAALLSRKRRKVATERLSGLPTRPVPEASFQLDYGQEEPSSALESSSAATTAPDKPSSPSTTPVPPVASDVEDGQIREEGEISDNEETSPPPPPPRTTSSRKNVPQIQPPTQDPNPVKAPPSIPLSSVKISASAPSPLETPPADHKPYHDTGSVRTATSEPFMFESTYVLDSEHVRPGLDMTQEQYDTSKDIILDLLGWGIPPEYLVDCGLSRQIVFYVFNELNLRLPNNLDTEGIISYPTPDMLSAVPASPSYSIRSTSSAMHIPPVRSDIDGQHSLDQRLQIERGGNPASSPANQLSSTQPSLASRLSPAPSQSLHDIEQLRRQELLARKAVIASRRYKQGDRSGEHSTSRASSKDKDVDMEPYVPTETVDDFLNSIGPSSDLDKGSGTARTARFTSPEAMDIDDPIPGLMTSGSVDFPISSREQSSVQSSLSFLGGAGPSRLNIPDSSNDRHLTSADSNGPTPLSTNSITSTFSVTLPETRGSIDATASETVPSVVTTYESNPPHQSRRGTKRPVAADFVDDIGPSRPHASSSGNGHANGTHLNPALRRKTGSFASVSGMRRCVIDLSDSEDDGEVRREYDSSGDSWERRTVSPMPPSLAMRHPSRVNTLSTPPMTFGVIANGGGRTPPNYMTSLSAPTLTGTLSPAALLEKEQEIKKMRELIAQREQSRLKKMVAMSGKSTPTSLAISTVAAPSVDSVPAPVKQEEDVSSSSLDTNLSPSTTTTAKQVAVDATCSGQPAVSSGEDTVMRDVPDRPPPDSGSFPPESTDKSTSSPTTRISDAIGKDGSSNTSDMSASATPSDDADAARAAWTSRAVEEVVDAQGLTLEAEAHSIQAVLHTQHPLHSPVGVQGQVDAADEVGASSSSAQIFHLSRQNQEESSGSSAMAFTTYRSPFAVYPLLRSQPVSAISPDESTSLRKDFSSQVGLAQSELSESHSHSLYHSISTTAPSVPSSSSQALSSSSTYSSSSHISFHRISLPDFQQLKQATLQRVLSQLTAGDTSRRVCHYEVPGGGVCRDQTCNDVHLSRITGSSADVMAIDVEPSDSDTATYVHDGLPSVWRARCNTRDIESALDATRRRGSMKGFEERVRDALVLLGIPVSSGTPTTT